MIRIYADDLSALVDRLEEFPAEYEFELERCYEMLQSNSFISVDTADPVLTALVQQFKIKHEVLA